MYFFGINLEDGYRFWGNLIGESQSRRARPSMMMMSSMRCRGCLVIIANATSFIIIFNSKTTQWPLR
jgi:hypothetical protein